MLNIALFGPPGAGKGTQAKKIVEKYNLAHLSTGEMIRKEIAEGSDFGKMAAGIINKGELLSDEFVVALIENSIEHHKNVDGFLFDELMRRMLERAKIEGRADDNEEVIENRFREYKAKTLPVADHYKVQKKHFSVNGHGTVEDVFQAITKILEEIR